MWPDGHQVSHVPLRNSSFGGSGCSWRGCVCQNHQTLCVDRLGGDSEYCGWVCGAGMLCPVSPRCPSSLPASPSPCCARITEGEQGWGPAYSPSPTRPFPLHVRPEIGGRRVLAPSRLQWSCFAFCDCAFPSVRKEGAGVWFRLLPTILLRPGLKARTGGGCP